MPRLRNSKRIKLIPTKSIHGSTDSVTVTLDPVIIKEGDHMKIVAKAKINSTQIPRFTYAVGKVSKIEDKTVTVTIEGKKFSPRFSYEVEAPRRQGRKFTGLFCQS